MIRLRASISMHFLLAVALVVVTAKLSVSQLRNKTESFIESQSDRYVIIEIDESDYLYKRFSILRDSAVSASSFLLKAKTTHSNENNYFLNSYQRVGCFVFEFSNLTTCKSAIDSVFTCFPNDCLRVQAGKPIGIKTTPSVYIINDTSIIILRTGCGDVDENWDKLVVDASKQFATNESIIALARCGYLDWTTKDSLEN
ncbi:hypothetical protein JYU19_00660 [bacterium AH-315-J21]|nr:hypothetical protein [bacterium AH-315-J21]